MAEVVDLAGDAIGLVVDESKGAVGDNSVLVTDDLEMVLDVDWNEEDILGHQPTLLHPQDC